MSEFAERLFKEKIDLIYKHEKLLAFLDTDKYHDLSGTEQCLLVAQAGAMDAYLAILRGRIALLGEKK